MKLQNKRRQKDVSKLVMSSYNVKLINNKTSEFVVKFRGPAGSAYEEGQWDVHVVLPEQYPFKSPSIGFMNRIYHPNIDLSSGSVCLDVINQTWSPMYELVNIFEIFLPQLLTYPNPTDPMNGEAARLYMSDKDKYQKKVREMISQHAKFEKQEKKKEEPEPVSQTLSSKKKPMLSEDQDILESGEDNSLSDVSDLPPLDLFSQGQNQ